MIRNRRRYILSHAAVDRGRILILDALHASLARPAFTDGEADSLAERIYGFVWQRSEAGAFTEAA